MQLRPVSASFCPQRHRGDAEGDAQDHDGGGPGRDGDEAGGETLPQD